ncbi:MAG: [FeFe] hydrogenase H-cluster maturation GTPase HydF [Cellulosilyticaceae bacterium]
MNHTPKGSQKHIGIFGKRNVGKSTLINGLLGQELSVVSPVAGTTTDIVHKSIEFHPLGPVVLIDTPGIDDEGELGVLRVRQTQKILGEVDAVLWVVTEELGEQELETIKTITYRNVPIIIVENQKTSMDAISLPKNISHIRINAKKQETLEPLRALIVEILKDIPDQCCIKDYIKEGDMALLVTPQDLQAPKGRLILPQVQVLREILDGGGIPIMTTPQTLDQVMEVLGEKIQWVITDSQVFEQVYHKIPKDIPLTSFSMIMGRQKGDLETYVEGAYAIKSLKEGDKVLVAESCSHNPLHGDIARMQIPHKLETQLGISLCFEHVKGNEFPDELEAYALVIQCGGCMQTRGQVMARIQKAKQTGVPITNFGVLLAHLSGILEKVFIPY